jgi:HK97 family phage prohead protease
MGFFAATKVAAPDITETEDVSPDWADGEWGRPALSDHPEFEEGTDYDSGTEEQRSAVAGRFIDGDSSAGSYGELRYPVVNPATGNLNRNGVAAAKSRASAEGDNRVLGVAQDLWDEHFAETKQVDLEPPEAVKNAARLALEAKEEYDLSDCGTGVGEDRARDIVSGDLTESDFTDGGEHETAIPDYLNSHSEDVSGITDPPSDWGEETWTDGCGPVQYALWGGTATGTGLEWAQSTAQQIEEQMQSDKDCGCKEEKMGPDVFRDPMAAQERADEIGCEGIHVHEQEGETVFMPCATHEMWQEMTDEEMDKMFSKIERLLKADVGDLNEGEFVEWDSSGGTAYGMIDTIAMGETVRGSLEPEDTEHETSEDNPGVIIELVGRDEDGEVMGEGDTVFHRPGELRQINEEDVPGEKGMHEDEEEEGMKSAVGERRLMSFETKQYEIKEDAEGEFKFDAYGAVFGNKDRGGDILEKGAFKRTIDHNDGRFPLVADHQLKLDSRLGVAYAEEDEHGVHVKGHINTDTQMGREVASHIRHAEKHDLSLGMSFGYEVVKDKYDKEKDARRLKEIKNHEFTVTQIPMNEEARVMGVKGILEDDDALEQLASKIKSLLLEDAAFKATLSEALDTKANDSLSSDREDSDGADFGKLAEEARELASTL